jgi:hypothetical protein
MVDPSDIKSGGSTDKKKKDKSKSKNKTATTSTTDSPDPYTQSVEDSPTPGDAKVAGVSKDWKDEHSDLNYQPENGEAEKEYVQRQVAECQEFYDNYVDMAKENMRDVNEFTMIHHTLGLALAEMVVGIKDVLRDEFGYRDKKAHKQTMKIVKQAGQDDAMNELVSELAKKFEDE